MSERIFLPVKEEGTLRVGFVSKKIADLVGPELDYYTKLAALGPRPDKEFDGYLEYTAWQQEASALANAYLDQLV